MQRAPTRVFGYARVSSAEQGRKGSSLAAQEAEIRGFCRLRHYPEPTVYVEIESGSGDATERRVEQARLLAGLQPGDLVVVAKQDRWSRDVLHYLHTTTEIAKRGARFHALAEGFDAATPEGRFAATLMAAVAEQERARILERTVGMRFALRERGLWVMGLPPLGFRVEEKRLVVDETTAPFVRRLYELLATGSSLTVARIELEREFGWTRDRQVLHRMVRNRHALGESRFSGGWQRTHDPLITEALWKRAQNGLDARRLVGRFPGKEARTAFWVLRGIARCARCGSKCGAAYSRNVEAPDGYYACCRRCGARYSRVSVVDERAAVVTLARLRHVRQELAKPLPVRDDVARVGRLEGRKSKLAGKRKRLIDMHADGAIDKAELATRLADVDAELRAVDVELADVEAHRRAMGAGVRAEMLADLGVLERAWSLASPAQRREVISLLSDRIELEGPEVLPTWKSAAALAVEDASTAACVRRRIVHWAKPLISPAKARKRA